MKFMKKLIVLVLALCLLISNAIVANAEETSDKKEFFFSSGTINSLTGEGLFDVDSLPSNYVFDEKNEKTRNGSRDRIVVSAVDIYTA